MATLISQVKGIVTGHNKSGTRVLWAIEQTIDHMFNHNDWTPLAWLMAKMEPASDGRLVRRIVGECVGGLTLVSKGKLAEEQPSGLCIKRGANAATTAKMTILRQLVKDGESFRGKAVREQLLEKKEAAFDWHKFVKNTLKRMDEEGKTIADLLAEVESVDKEAKTIDVTEPEHKDAKKIKAMAA